MTNTGNQIKNNQSETAIIYVGYVLLLISSLVSARFAYLQQSNAILGIFFAIGMMGINMSVPYLIRWAIVSKRERRYFPMIIALIGIYWITSYSLSASSTLFTAGLQQNENLVLADRLAFDAQDDLVKQTNLEYSEMKKRGGFNASQFAQQEIRMNMAGYQSKMKQADILRNGTLDLQPKFLLWSIAKATIAMFMALALEFAIIGIISFKEAVLTPTPLSGILRYVDQWLAPDVRVEDAVLKNPWGGGDANNIGMINETVTKKELKLRKKTNKLLPTNTLDFGEGVARPTMGFIDTNNIQDPKENDESYTYSSPVSDRSDNEIADDIWFELATLHREKCEPYNLSLSEISASYDQIDITGGLMDKSVNKVRNGVYTAKEIAQKRLENYSPPAPKKESGKEAGTHPLQDGNAPVANDRNAPVARNAPKPLQNAVERNRSKSGNAPVPKDKSAPENEGIGSKELKVMLARMEVAKTAKIGDMIPCANCGTKTEKRIDTKRFCQTQCRIDYHKKMKKVTA